MLLFFYLIWGHVFSWKRWGDPVVKLHKCSPGVQWRPSAIHVLSMGHLGCHLGCITAQESSPGCVQTGQTHLGAPQDPCALHVESEEAQPVWLLCRGVFGQFVVFLWKWKLAYRARAAFTPWHITGCFGTFLRALSSCVLQIIVYISSDLRWTRWATLRFHQGV